MMATTPAIKAENVDAIPKIDPDALSPTNSADDDSYEDTGELEMPKQDQVRNGWLTRVPKFLYDVWSNIEEDEEVQIGIVRKFGNGKTQLILEPNSKHSGDVPKNYDLNTTDTRSQNIYVFSEKDFPGYKSKSKRNDRQAHGQDRKNPFGPQDRKGVGKYKRFQPFFRRAIPKQTSLNARISDEVSCVAVENDEYRKLIKKHIAAADASRPGVSFLEGDPREYAGLFIKTGDSKKGPINPGFDTFVRTGIAPGRVKQQDNKAARMPRSDLIDELFNLFKQYRYWTVKALRYKLNQPEAYLREVLNGIAELVKSGPFSGNYKLKPESMVPLDIDPKEEAAPPGEDETSAMEEDEAEEDIKSEDDEDLEMEDALP